MVWSARLSTGIFGLPNCRSGNSSHAPKGENEVLLAVGDVGLANLIDLGFVPCPTCHPEETENFWEKTKEIIEFNHPHLSDAKQILDRNLVPFDARRLDWEKIAPFLKQIPARLYVQPNLKEVELLEFKKRINDLGFTLPPTGSYMNSVPYFKEYIIK